MCYFSIVVFLFFSFFIEFITNKLMHLYFLFGVMLIPFFWFQGYPKYVQA